MSMHVCQCSYMHTIYFSEQVHSFQCASTCSERISFVYENQGLEEFPLRVCIYECVFPHNKACSLIFNAAETTTGTQSEPREACFPAQTNLPCQQETKLRDTVWNGSKHGSRHPRTLNPPNDIQGILSTEQNKHFCRFRS